MEFKVVGKELAEFLKKNVDSCADEGFEGWDYVEIVDGDVDVAIRLRPNDDGTVDIELVGKDVDGGMWVGESGWGDPSDRIK